MVRPLVSVLFVAVFWCCQSALAAQESRSGHGPLSTAGAAGTVSVAAASPPATPDTDATLDPFLPPFETHDLSSEREKRYVKSVRDWLAGLEPLQRERARAILREAHPAIHDLRVQIREKKAELEDLRFDSSTPPDALPRLGRELQQLRRQLRERLRIVSERLRSEAGISMGPLDGDGFWLTPPRTDAVTGSVGYAAPGTPGTRAGSAAPGQTSVRRVRADARD